MYVSLNAITIHLHGNHVNETTRSHYMPEQTHSQPAVRGRILFTPSPTWFLILPSKKYSEGVEEMTWGMKILISSSY